MAERNQPYEIMLIGAGVSGLSMAHYWAKQGIEALVLEAATRPGGCVCSHRLADNRFWVELGAHSCFNSYSHLVDVLAELNLLGQIRKREKVPFKFWVDESLKSIPSQLHVLELLVSLPRLTTTQKTGRSVAEYYGGIAGRRNYAEVLGPAFDAVICQPAAHFPADLLFARKARRKDVIRSFTFSDGLQTLIDALVKRQGVNVHLGEAVTEVACTADRFTVTTTQGERYQSRRLCLATPAKVAANLLKNAFPELAELLNRIACAKVESIGVVAPREAVAIPPLAGIIARNGDFYSVVSRDTVYDPNYRGFTFHFKPNRLNVDEQLKQICRLLGVGQNQLAGSIAVTNRLPTLAVGHQELIRRIDELLVGKPLALTGNYFTGVSLEDCVARSFKEFSRLWSADQAMRYN